MLGGEHDCYEYDHITYLQDFKKNSYFSFMQSIILIAAFLAGSNKESTDIRLFDIDRSKFRCKTGNANQAKPGANLLGKTKRFGIDRLTAIVDYLSSLEIDGANECKKLNHSAEFYACINTLVDEDLLKRQGMRAGGGSGGAGGDELVNMGFKCNFDHNFVQDVADKINFRLEEYLFGEADE